MWCNLSYEIKLYARHFCVIHISVLNFSYKLTIMYFYLSTFKIVTVRINIFVFLTFNYGSGFIWPAKHSFSHILVKLLLIFLDITFIIKTFLCTKFCVRICQNYLWSIFAMYTKELNTSLYSLNIQIKILYKRIFTI